MQDEVQKEVTAWRSQLRKGSLELAVLLALRKQRRYGMELVDLLKLGVLLGAGEQGFGLFALNLFLSASLGSVVTALIGGIGEELGWRGFLQPSLERRWGPLKGTIAVGLIWAYWHLPANLMGYNDDKHPLLNALLLFPVAVVAMSFGFAWLARRSGSAWPAALAHGANNTLSGAFLMTPQTWSADAATELLSMALVSAVFVRMSLQQKRGQRPEPTGAPVPVSA